jgi:hypothetical protein
VCDRVRNRSSLPHNFTSHVQHGRVKVRTTEEQQALKNKERQEKLKAYLYLKDKIFAKVCVCVRACAFPFRAHQLAQQRERREYDAEALTLTGHLLGKNPDFASVFNFRREVMAHLFERYVAQLQAHTRACHPRLTPALHVQTACSQRRSSRCARGSSSS